MGRRHVSRGQSLSRRFCTRSTAWISPTTRSSSRRPTTASTRGSLSPLVRDPTARTEGANFLHGKAVTACSVFCGGRGGSFRVSRIDCCRTWIFSRPLPHSRARLNQRDRSMGRIWVPGSLSAQIRPRRLCDTHAGCTTGFCTFTTANSLSFSQHALASIKFGTRTTTSSPCVRRPEKKRNSFGAYRYIHRLRESTRRSSSVPKATNTPMNSPRENAEPISG